MGKEKSLPLPWTLGGRLELPGGRRWVGDENGYLENSPPKLKKELPLENQTELLELEGKQPRFGFGRGIFNPEV